MALLHRLDSSPVPVRAVPSRIAHCRPDRSSPRHTSLSSRSERDRGCEGGMNGCGSLCDGPAVRRYAGLELASASSPDGISVLSRTWMTASTTRPTAYSAHQQPRPAPDEGADALLHAGEAPDGVTIKARAVRMAWPATMRIYELNCIDMRLRRLQRPGEPLARRRAGARSLVDVSRGIQRDSSANAAPWWSNRVSRRSPAHQQDRPAKHRPPRRWCRRSRARLSGFKDEDSSTCRGRPGRASRIC